MGRKPVSKLDLLRAKTWAHTCAWCASSEKGKKATTSELVRLVNNHRVKKNVTQRIDTGFWSRCLRGEKGVRSTIVNELGDPNLWPLAKDAYVSGPPAFCGPPDDDFYFAVPLWGALSNNEQTLIEGWKKIPNGPWIEWSPWNAFTYEYECYDGQVITETEEWEGPSRCHFRTGATLYAFLEDYRGKELSPLLGLTIDITRAILAAESSIKLHLTFNDDKLDGISTALQMYDITLEDLAEAAAENGFHIDTSKRIPRPRSIFAGRPEPYDPL